MYNQPAKYLSLILVLLFISTTQSRAQNIVGLSPSSISAGTGNRLVITGTGFGTGPASSTRYVEFANADDGGSSGVRPLSSDYVSWSDNKIEVIVPSKAGTGQVRVANGAASGSSSTKLNVTFNLINAGMGPARHVNKNLKGGYTFHLEKKFNDQADVKNAFVKSLSSWTCLTGINWTIGETTTVDLQGKDGINIVRFDQGGELPAGVLGVAYTYSSSCAGGNWEITETDLVFDGEQNWHYNDVIPPVNKYDFQSVALHELGHAHNLGHVIDQSDLMNYAIGPGTSRRILSANNQAGGDYQVTYSTSGAGGGCSGAMVKNQPGKCNFAFPTITSMSPEQGGEGRLIKISGQAFMGTSLVTFGGTPASFKVISDTQIEAVVGKGSSGELAVTTPGGTAAFGKFKFIPPPVIVSFSPHFGAVGDTILIAGTSLEQVDSLSFGGVAASFELVDDVSVLGIVGPGASGKVEVSTQGGRASLAGFEFITRLRISSFSPKRAAMGDTIRIKGEGFKSIKGVKFGNRSALKFGLLDTLTLYAIVGEGGSGSVQIESDYGKSELAGFEFLPAPAISSFFPATAGEGMTVRVYGVNFTGVTSVMFGNHPAKHFDITSPSIITAVVGKARSGDVVVRSEGGTGTRAGFEFLEVLEIRSFDPKIATTGTKVIISGSRFRKVSDVTFGGRPAVSFTVDSPEQITAVVGAGASGAVSVITADGVISMEGFTFQLPPAVSFFSPAVSGLGSTVLITGSNFQNATAVLFGGVAAASYKVLSESSIEARVFTGSSGDVTVSTPVGEASLAGFRFVPPPIITTVDPSVGGIGTTITIRGVNLRDTRTLRIGSTEISAFTISGDTILTVVLPAALSEGTIILSSIGGTVESKLFRFVPSPLLRSFYPDHAIAGVKVFIQGENLADVKTVTFGGKPAESFEVLSSSEIAAIISANSSSGSVEIMSPGGKSSRAGFVFTFTLPSNNFTVSTTDVTCRAAINGMISISAASTMNYSAVITGKGTTMSYRFSNTLELKNYSAGDYFVCITVDGQSSYKQCFDITIKEPKELALFSVIRQDGSSVDLKMQGGQLYYVELNGKLMHAGSGDLNLELQTGSNKIKLYTDQACQGVIERTINISDRVVVFPNPFTDVLSLQFPPLSEGIFDVEIRDLSGKIRLSKSGMDAREIARLSLQELDPGHYILLIKKGSYRSYYKIMKRNM